MVDPIVQRICWQGITTALVFRPSDYVNNRGTLVEHLDMKR